LQKEGLGEGADGHDDFEVQVGCTFPNDSKAKVLTTRLSSKRERRKREQKAGKLRD
jgi:hypothetical protein